MGLPRDFYHKELIPNFFNTEWTMTSGQPNYYFTWNLDPFNLNFMKTYILGNKIF